MNIFLIFFLLISYAYPQESRECPTNPLRDKEYCKYFWSLCKGLGIRRLDGIKACLEKSQSYEEGIKCFERSWIEDLFKR
ncbi:MAG: hypothetical protein RMK75_02980 [Aquificaceae bacterium]|nr:hypothetical protein [Aquificaceae bacterium]MDW8423273.1 hypothetical protein [Aquificaceae bacterium]